MLVHASDVAGVVTGLARGVEEVGGAQGALLTALDEVVLDLGAPLDRESLFRCGSECLLEDDSRGERPGLAFHMRIAVDEGQAVADEGDRGERREVGERDQVGVFRHLADGTRGVAGEPDTVALQFVGGFDGNQLGTRLSRECRENGDDEASVGRAVDVGLGWAY